MSLRHVVWRHRQGHRAAPLPVSSFPYKPNPSYRRPTILINRSFPLMNAVSTVAMTMRPQVDPSAISGATRQPDRRQALVQTESAPDMQISPLMGIMGGVSQRRQKSSLIRRQWTEGSDGEKKKSLGGGKSNNSTTTTGLTRKFA